MIVDTLAFIRSNGGPPQVTDVTKRNIRESGVGLFCLTVARPWDMTAEEMMAACRQATTVVRKADNGRLFRAVTTRGDLEDLGGKGPVGVIFTVQEPGPMYPDPILALERLHENGVRVIQIGYQDQTRFIPDGAEYTGFGSGFLEDPDTGLTEAGRRVLDRAYELGMIIDLSHAGHQTARDVLAYFKGKIMISHTGCHAVYPHARNTPDDVLVGIARRGGVVGLYTLTFFLGKEGHDPELWANHMRHLINLIGVEHICIGSDGAVGGPDDMAEEKAMFPRIQQHLDPDGRLGSRFPTHIPHFNRPTGYENMINELSRLGVIQPDRMRIMGRNALEFFQNALPQ